MNQYLDEMFVKIENFKSKVEAVSAMKNNKKRMMKKSMKKKFLGRVLKHCDVQLMREKIQTQYK